MRVEITYCSDTGLVREHNEDYLGTNESVGLVVLADGMGGYQAGEVASRLAVETVMKELVTSLQNLTTDRPEIANGYHRVTILLEQAVIKANQVIYRTAEQQLHYHGMGTTVVAAVFYDNFISIAHVGDSRLYRLRGTELKQLTVDHSVLQELIDCGYYPREQARYFPNKNIVTRALGVSETVSVDIREEKVVENDIYLLCSDGLNDMLEDIEIQNILSDTHSSLQQSAQLLVKMANHHGGEDNVSVILARPLAISPNNQSTWLKKLFNYWR